MTAEIASLGGDGVHQKVKGLSITKVIIDLLEPRNVWSWPRLHIRPHALYKE